MNKHLRDVISLIIVFLSIVVIVSLLTRRMEIREWHQAGTRVPPAGVTTGKASAYTEEVGYPVSVMELTDASD